MTERLIEPPEPDHVIVVYDERTGQVRHVHQEITLPGGRAAPAGEVMRRAIDMAHRMGETGSPADKLAGLALSGDDRRLLHRRRASLRVDAATRRLVAAGS
jgi:hypothetical protein